MKKFYLLLLFAGVSVLAQNAWRPLGRDVLDQLSPDGNGGPLQLNGNGVPYLYCNDRLLAFNSNTWQQIGPTIPNTYGYDLVFDAVNVPVVAMSDGNGNVSVRKMTGGVWQSVGNVNISAVGSVNNALLAVSPTNQLYLAFSDGGNAYDIHIKKFDGTNWSDVGNIESLDTSIVLKSFQFNPTGIPYFAGTALWAGNKPVVMTLNGTQWENVGAPFMQSMEVTDFDIAPNGDPYLLTKNNLQQSTLSKFENGIWTTAMQLPANHYLSRLNFAEDSSFYFTYIISENQENFLRVAKWINGEFITLSSHEVYIVAETETQLDANNNPVVAYRAGLFPGFNVLRYTSGSFIQMGNTGFTDDVASDLNFEVNHHNIPVVAYIKNQDYGIVARKFNGTTWDRMGGYCPGTTLKKILFDSQDRTYLHTLQYVNQDVFIGKLCRFSSMQWDVIYESSTMQDVGIASNDDIYVLDSNQIKMYNGNNWQTLPNYIDTSIGESGGFLKLDSQDRPYVLTWITNMDTGEQTRQFKRYENGVWENIGSAFYSNVSSGYDVIYQVGNDGGLYYMYRPGLAFDVVVNRIINGQTQMLGGINLTGSMDLIDPHSLALDQNGTPYVTFQKYTENTDDVDYIVVYKFNGLSWELVEDKVVDYDGWNPNVKINNFNQPMVGFAIRGFYVYYYGEPDSYTLGLTNQIGSQLQSGTLYPNPARSLVSIYSQSPVEEVVIYDLSGKKVHSVKNTNQISVENLSPGLYIAKVKTENGTQSLKLIKE